MSKKEIISNIVWFGGLIVILLSLRAFVFSPTNVSGNSMNPTMVDRERVIAMKQSKVERFDIVTFPAPDNPSKNYIKRVIGLPGDTIEFKEDQLLINGKKYDEPYLEEYKKAPSDVKTPYGLPLTQDFNMTDVLGEKKVPEGKFFVMGDNRQNSKDSRMIGFIDEDNILGNVKFVFWPPAKWGTIN